MEGNFKSCRLFLMAVLIILFFSACNRVMVINISFEDVPSQTPLPATLTAIQKLIPPTETPTPTPTATLTPTLTPTPTSSTTPTITNTPPPTQTPTPSCLRLLTPSDGSLLKQIGRIYFTWEELPNAAGYIIEFTSPDGVPVRFKAASAEHLRYAESLPWGGVFTWRVIALDWDGSELCSTNSWRFSKPAPPPTDVPPTATSEERWDWWGRHGTPHPPHHHHP